MLEIKEITKIYKTKDIEQKALDKVSINFRKNEFVSILGQSGSGKSTLLNIIGGLDHYTSGDLIIDGVSTRRYRAADWDTYRNHKVGFIFQNYNLIMHQSVLSNVELALTLSGESKFTRRKKAKEALRKVGLENHMRKSPKQLSGGQMQRVAIARALVNNPEIILADEPTGALDSETSVQIMDLLKEVAKDKLVIMVTHNPELAKEYSTRIVNLKDGRIIDDTMPFDGKEEIVSDDNKKRKSMGLFTALSLSLNNLLTKKGRTLLTAFAGSIGIIGIAAILALSNGVRNYANNMQEESSGAMAVSIKSNVVDSSKSQAEIKSSDNNKKSHPNKIVATDDISSSMVLNEKSTQRKNNLKNMKEYIESHKQELEKYASDIKYVYNVDLNIYDKNSDGSIVKVNPVENTGNVADTGLFSSLSSLTYLIQNSFSLLLDESNYEVLSGHMPKEYNELVLVVNEKNELPLSVMYALNIENKLDISEFMKKAANGEKVSLEDVSYDFEKIIGKQYKVINATDFYTENNKIWTSRQNDNNYIKELYENGTDLKIVGIVKVKNENIANGYLGYSEDLPKYIMKKANDTDIVRQQLENKEINVFTGMPFDEMLEESLENNLKILGAGNEEDPYTINIYPKDSNAKKEIKKFIDDYNKNLSEDDKIIYSDEMELLINGIVGIVDMISAVMVAFVAISLIVSSIMIGIITYISVLERTKEIGILRAIGASKKDVKRVFIAETIIEGLVSGTLGIILTQGIVFVVNAIVSKVGKIDNIMQISITNAVILIAVSVVLTVIAGLGPASIASKKDPVESLRGE